MAQERIFARHELAGAGGAELRLQFLEDGCKVLLQHRAFEQQHRQIAHVEQLLQLVRRGEGADRGAGGAGQGRAEEGRDPFEPVGHHHADALVLADPAGEQGAGDLNRALPQIVVGPA